MSTVFSLRVKKPGASARGFQICPFQQEFVHHLVCKGSELTLNLKDPLRCSSGREEGLMIL